MSAKWAKGTGGPAGDEARNLIAVNGGFFEPTIAFKGGQGSKSRSIGAQEECSPTLGSAESGSQRAPTIAFQSKASAHQSMNPGEVSPALDIGKSDGVSVMAAMAVRRLTPRECERLQGFPDDYTQVPYRNKPAADGPRYKALGNSWAVPCARYIGERINLVNGLIA